MAQFWGGFSHSPGCKQSTYRQPELRARWEISSKGKNSPSRGFIPRKDKFAFEGAGLRWARIGVSRPRSRNFPPRDFWGVTGTRPVRASIGD